MRHTFALPIEKTSKIRVRQGDAVAMGLAADGDLPKRLGKSIRLVLPVKAGEVFVAGKVTRQDILKTLEAMSG